ncbi:MAG: hypothetical protein L0Z50_37085 [Verrucomicrobiales bacterium]|nr:hypothetical protein [Verrucomicrobiales bacterium]
MAVQLAPVSTAVAVNGRKDLVMRNCGLGIASNHNSTEFKFRAEVKGDHQMPLWKIPLDLLPHSGTVEQYPSQPSSRRKDYPHRSSASSSITS